MQTVLRKQTFVGARRYEYDFRDKNDGRQVTGTTYYVALVEQDPLGYPVEVKCSQAQYERLVALGFGAEVDAACEIQAKNNRVIYVAESFTDSGTGEILRAVS